LLLQPAFWKYLRTAAVQPAALFSCASFQNGIVLRMKTRDETDLGKKLRSDGQFYFNFSPLKTHNHEQFPDPE